jgi:CHAT domain-containing protein
MPFHAARIHARGSLENALGRVISSYTPSIKALDYTRSQIKHMHNDHPPQGYVLVTLLPTTPKGSNDKDRFSALRGVSKEKEKILRIISPHMNTIVCTTPSVDDVLGRLEDCQMARFACHGRSDLVNLSNDGLVLQRVTTDRTLEQDRLSVYLISQLRLEHAHIAYLSACSTAENRGRLLQDEVIHIVSGFQVAGLPHIVGSLRPAVDAECVQVVSLSARTYLTRVAYHIRKLYRWYAHCKKRSRRYALTTWICH